MWKTNIISRILYDLFNGGMFKKRFMCEAMLTFLIIAKWFEKYCMCIQLFLL
jgi:hypothetical protein